MRTIDLNADLGELADGSLDAAVMPFISSANIACGAHAGSAESIRRTLRLALRHGVAIGAHPGYPDPANFGRVSMPFSTEALCALVLEQLRLLRRIAAEEGAAVRHVKLHGALYNDLADDYGRSLSLCRAIHGVDPKLRLIGRSGSACLRAAEDAGLVAVHETFADRAYTQEGRLVPRSQPGAVIHDEAESLAQVEMMVLRNQVPTLGGKRFPIQADSVCVHGDNPSAIQFVSNLRAYFARHRIEVCPAGRLRFSYAALDETSLLARLPPRIAKSTHRRIRALQWALDGSAGIRELVPCYAELKIDFDPALVSLDELIARIDRIELEEIDLPQPRCVEVPVHYNGPDLSLVARHNGLSETEVVARHAAPTYLVYMLGFSPGFAYLGGLDDALATPRLATPRVAVPAGAVGIAGNQTGVYPVESPGGWNIIGHTSLNLFDPTAEKPFLFEAGDEVRFMPIEKMEDDAPSAPRFVHGSGGASPSGGWVEIIEPGLYTTVQDAGRPGYLRYGLPVSGAMDRRALQTANALVGNKADAAVLECTGTMPVLQFSESLKIAVVYADHFQTLEVSAGERVKFQPLETGYRAYLAFAGGIDVPLVMGSRSTYLPGKLGGFQGRTLQAGDELPLGCGVAGPPPNRRYVPQVAGPLCRSVRVVPGPEADWFDCGGLNTFLTEAFCVSATSNRTGLRLDGPPLSFHSEARQMVSAGLGFGTIQVPPSGRPIVMMADHPTTGGYPRIGHVVAEDLPLLAQARPGDSLRFAEVR